MVANRGKCAEQSVNKSFRSETERKAGSEVFSHLMPADIEFDTIVTNNISGDILSNEASMLTGSFRMLPSASLGESGPGLFEPIYGFALDIAGQWPGSYCDTKQGCCYPKTGKPATDFIIYGLQPYSNLGSPLLNCDRKAQTDTSKISKLSQSLQTHWPSLACPSKNGMKHWSNEWYKYGTCSKSILDQHKYFEAAINLKKKVNLLKILQTAGIQQNGKFYNVGHIAETIRIAIGYQPGIHCSVDKLGNSQLNLVYLCSNTLGTQIIECPGMVMGTCKTTVKFPPF
ncbi:hypothetical protein IFM89_016651 [Coptis chinensis]|uniref:Uncharacterized protein n=1 Tax=Coptis chinensis TaxID=261450 RepID=A0A835M9A1_9MAGN|nr:hypothetical protein IFM89_016651 [Coptis chinensis]